MVKHWKYGIVIPAANEADNILAFTDELVKEISALKIDARVFFVVDNVSKDGTRQILEKISKKNPIIQVVFEPKNRSVVDAYVRGYREALVQKCDAIIEMDAGFSHLPNELPKFVQGIREGNDCVFGIRPLWSPTYQVPMIRRLLSLGGTILGNVMLGTQFRDMTSGYEAFTRRAAEEVLRDPLLSTGHFFQTELKYRARRFKYKEVPIQYQFPSSNVRSSSIENSFQTLWFYTKQRFK